MNEPFRQDVEQLHEKFEALMQMEPVRLAGLPRQVPQSDIYLFSEEQLHRYVGRSKRLRQRLRYHSGSAVERTAAVGTINLSQQPIRLTSSPPG